MTTQTLTPRARAGDPETSVEAARSVTDLRPKQQAILTVMAWRRKLDGCTHEELISDYDTYQFMVGDLPPQSESGIRTRCSELVTLGRICDSGERRIMSTGRKAIVWKLA